MHRDVLDCYGLSIYYGFAVQLVLQHIDQLEFTERVYLWSDKDVL